MVAARQLRIPGIVLLLIGGFVLGPEGFGIVNPDVLGDLLGAIVAISVGLILFEGGLTLNLQGYMAMASVIRKLLTVGVLVTWLATAFLIWLFYRFHIGFCLLAASLVIVTGPTVIQPILKRIRLKWNLHNILHWEGVMIDPVGVFIAVLAFEWGVAGDASAALQNLGLRLAAGLIIGVVGGEIIYRLLRYVAEDVVNVFAVGAAVLVYGLTELVIDEAGLLSVTIAGLIVGSRQPQQLAVIREFKGVLTDLLIGLLFMLLVSRLRIEQFTEFGTKGLLMLAIFLLVVRPLSILLVTRGEKFSVRDIIFLSWVAPRGVVAASIASLFTLSLINELPEARFLETFTFSVIAATVILQGLTAGPLAKILRLQQKHPEGWLIVGAHGVGRAFARFLKEEANVSVLLVDTNRSYIAEAEREGLPAIQADAREVEALERRPEMRGIGQVLAVTDNEDLNELLCSRWGDNLGKDYVYRWSASAIRETGRSGAGKVIWKWMQRPSVVDAELGAGESAIVTVEQAAVSTRGSLTVLCAIRDGKLSIDPDPADKEKNRKASVRLLCLQREIDPLLEAIHHNLVVQLRAKTPQEVIRTLAGKIGSLPAGLSEERISEAVQKIESQASSNLGHGVAIPHARFPDLQQGICAVAQLSEPIDWDGTAPVQLVFLLISPEDEPENHIGLLGEIARLTRDKEVREKLFNAHSSEKLMEIIRRQRSHS